MKVKGHWLQAVWVPKPYPGACRPYGCHQAILVSTAHTGAYRLNGCHEQHAVSLLKVRRAGPEADQGARG